MLIETLASRHVSEFAADVRAGLTKSGQRELPSKYLYDEVGSALFEAISVLPEYGLTRADARLLEKHARQIVGLLPSPIHVAELGSGSGKKNALDSGSAVAATEDLLLSYRDFAFGAGGVREGIGADRSGEHRRA